MTARIRKRSDKLRFENLIGAKSNSEKLSPRIKKAGRVDDKVMIMRSKKNISYMTKEKFENEKSSFIKCDYHKSYVVSMVCQSCEYFRNQVCEFEVEI